MERKQHKPRAIDFLLGVATGDALGVPYEFLSRHEMDSAPAEQMTGFGTYNQPPGTWSDDSSLTFCLAEAVAEGYTHQGAARRFVRWASEAYWTAHDEVFDIGTTTIGGIHRLEEILKSGKTDAFAALAGKGSEKENGNGALMRTMPLLLTIKGRPIENQFRLVYESSALTHRHIRSGMSCMVYLKLAEYMYEGMEKHEAYENTRQDIRGLWKQIGFSWQEQEHFSRVITNDIRPMKRQGLLSEGYVVYSLEASLWSFLNAGNFEDTVLKAVNLGHDTDTNGAIAGGLAGLYYGEGQIPQAWKQSLAKLDEIQKLGQRLDKAFPV